MVKLTFVEHDGTSHPVEAPVGISVMQAARDNSVPGIMADCGGECSCATCHAYLDPEFYALAGVPHADEREMLEGAIDPAENSRLTCQIMLSENLDGMIVRLPASQT